MVPRATNHGIDAIFKAKEAAKIVNNVANRDSKVILYQTDIGCWISLSARAPRSSKREVKTTVCVFRMMEYNT